MTRGVRMKVPYYDIGLVVQNISSLAIINIYAGNVLSSHDRS